MESGNLVLQRNLGETVHIGDDITVTVGALTLYSCKLIFNAPKHIAIDRHEIYMKKQAERGLL